MEDLPAPSSGISRADTLPDITDEHAQCLHKLQVSDGDFHTEAKVNGELFPGSDLYQQGVVIDVDLQ